jgi:DNA-binding NarL/FixJ family response regulator
MTERINVHIRALDPLSQAGVMHTLRHRPEVWLLTDEDLATERVADPSVALVVTENVDEETVKVLEAVHQFGRRRVVLVASRVEDGMLLAAVEAGVCSVVPRAHATAERLVHALQTTASGAGSLPPDLLGRLLAQVSKLQRHVLAPHGLSRTGLSDRETEVLRMVADGMDTREIADRLGYSERTVKNVLHDITSRLQLKNRSHAVAYALREGLI